MNKTGRILIGTSNIVVPGNKTTFPPAFQQGTRLHYYGSLFNTVEINACFYKIPRFTTYEKWATEVPHDFQFSLKLTRDATHAKDLCGDWSQMERFMQTAAGIGSKKGCLLVQFPGKITLDYFSKVEEIMQYLRDLDPADSWKKAIEFRNDSWYVGETRELLNEYHAAMVLHDIPKGKLSEPLTKAGFIYIRFHGPKGDYRGSYDDKFLKTKAKEIKTWLKESKDVYVYFNNTIGNAFENALKLKELIKL